MYQACVCVVCVCVRVWDSLVPGHSKILLQVFSTIKSVLGMRLGVGRKRRKEMHKR